MGRRAARIGVIGAGVGGLSAALALAVRGAEVTVLERAGGTGGKLCGERVGEVTLDAGPTVFTMPWVFRELLQPLGRTLEEVLPLRQAPLLARHSFEDGGVLDLFAEAARNEAAIEAFAGAREADGYRRFLAYARTIQGEVEGPFLRGQRPTVGSIVAHAGLRLPRALARIDGLRTMRKALEGFFRDERLRQLFGRYATYAGSSPFEAPATLHVIAAVEQEGVFHVEGGMARLATTLEALVREQGGVIETGVHVDGLVTSGGRVTGLRTAAGERAFDAVVCNADASALASGLFGAEARAGLEVVPPAQRSLSALTWLVHAEAQGFPLARHTVFFGGEPRREFDELFAQRRLPGAPTVYVCAQDRDDLAAPGPGPERLLVLVNAPADGDRDAALPEEELSACEAKTWARLARAGLTLTKGVRVRTTPREFARRFPATGGALYGAASHDPWASFRRPGARTKRAGLYLAGGSVHPGAGVPMASLSGQRAAEAICEDLASTFAWRTTATPGGTSTSSPTTQRRRSS